MWLWCACLLPPSKICSALCITSRTQPCPFVLTLAAFRGAMWQTAMRTPLLLLFFIFFVKIVNSGASSSGSSGGGDRNGSRSSSSSRGSSGGDSEQQQQQQQEERQQQWREGRVSSISASASAGTSRAHRRAPLRMCLFLCPVARIFCVHGHCVTCAPGSLS